MQLLPFYSSFSFEANYILHINHRVISPGFFTPIESYLPFCTKRLVTEDGSTWPTLVVKKLSRLWMLGTETNRGNIVYWEIKKNNSMKTLHFMSQCTFWVVIKWLYGSHYSSIITWVRREEKLSLKYTWQFTFRKKIIYWN